MRLTPPSPARALIAALGLALACQGDDAKLTAHLERGHAYMEAEQYAEAILEFGNVLRIDPNHADAHYQLARSFIKTGRPREAFWELRESVRLDPANLEARRRLGQFLLIAQELDEALGQGSALVEAAPGEARGYMIRAAALFGLKRPDEAIQGLHEAVERVPPPESAEPMLALANALARTGSPDEAEVWYRKTSEVAPSYDAYLALGLHLRRARDASRDADAELAFQRALELATEPDDLTRAHEVLAAFYSSRGREDEGLALLQRGIEELEDPLDLIYLLARLHAERGERTESEALLQRAVREAPDDPEPLLVLSRHHSSQGDPESALAAVEQALAVAPTHVPARLRKAQLLIESGFAAEPPGAPAGEDAATRLAAGREIVDAVLADEPRHPEALLLRARFELAGGESASAVTSLQALLEERPDSARAHSLLGTAFTSLGDYEAARTELMRALELDPRASDTRRLLVRVHAALGEHEQAIAEGRRFLRERPGRHGTALLVAESLIRLRRWDEALAELEQIPEERRTPDVLYTLARARHARGETHLARPLLMRALDSRPRDAQLLRRLFWLGQKLAMSEVAVRRIDEALAAAPEDPKLHALRGFIFLVAGETESAEAGFEKAVELDPNFLRAYDQLARLYALTGRLEEAIATYEAAVRTHPQAAALHHLLGMLYQYSGDRTRAIASYEAAIANAPDFAESKNNLAYLLAEAGDDTDRALALAQEARAALPESPEVADTLGWVLLKKGVRPAAIARLREAEAGLPSDDPTLGIVRYRLAQAYEANGQPAEALATLVAALAEEAELRKASPTRVPLAWEAEARTLLERLELERLASLDDLDRWLLGVLRTGRVGSAASDWPAGFVARADVHASYLGSARDEASAALREDELLARLAKIFGDRMKQHSKTIDGEPTPVILLPPLEEARAAFEIHLGSPVDWGRG